MNFLDSLARSLGFVRTSVVDEIVARHAGAEARPRRRGFEGASVSRLTADWLAHDLVIDDQIRGDLRRLRARCRDLSKNNDYARRYRIELAANVLGSEGIITQSEVVNETFEGGKRKTTPDYYARTVIEDAWYRWQERENCLVTRDMALPEVDQVILKTIATDGASMIRRVKGFPHNPFRYALQLIPMDCLDIDYNGVLPNGNTVSMGVERGADWGEVVAYHLWTRPPNASVSSTSSNRRRERLPADEILHPFISEEIGQSTGYPWYATTITRLRQLGKYEEAAVINARQGASKGGFIERSSDAEAYEGETEEGTDSIISETEPGMIELLPIGHKFVSHNPDYPNAEYDLFRKGVLRGVAAGLSCSYNLLGQDLQGVNYSSLRAGLLDEREIWMMIQGFYIRAVRHIIFCDFVEMALLSGQCGNLPYSKLEKFKAAKHQARRWPWVDPQKDIEAAKEAIALRIKSRRKIIAETGEDRDEVFRDIADDHQSAKDAGIELPDPAAKNAAPAPGGKPKQEEPEDPETEE